MTDVTTAVCFDIGRTSCRCRVYHVSPQADPRVVSPDTIVIESGSTLSDAEGPERVAGLVSTCLQGIEPTGVPATLVVATAGAMEHHAAAEGLADRLAAAHHLPVLVTGDIVAAHAGCLNGRGVVAVAGTGAVALALDTDGKATKVDGNGYLLGDAGSGFAVGRAGLDAALRHHDGRPGGSAVLAAVAEQRFGPLAALPAVLQTRADAPRAVASFATQVADAAQAGDEVSSQIWRNAVDDLAETITAAAQALSADGPPTDVPVVLTGGLFAGTDLLTTPLCARLRGRFPSIGPADGDALLGAARLAADPAGAYAQLLTTRTTSPQRKPEEARR